jgi:hypothetical protein
MNPGRGIALKVASTFVFTLMLVCVKAVADTIPPGQIVFSRSFFALAPIVACFSGRANCAARWNAEALDSRESRRRSALTAWPLNFAALGTCLCRRTWPSATLRR